MNMIVITEGFTSISAGADSIAPPPPLPGANGSQTHCRRAPTGARVTLEFSRAAALPPDAPIKLRYEFGDRGILREVVGIAKQTQVEVRWGCAAVYHYRLSHWIAPGELLSIATGNVRQRTEQGWERGHDSANENR